MSNFLKNLFVVIVVFLLISAVFALLNPQALQKSPSLMTFSQLVADINQGKVKSLTVAGNQIEVLLQTGEKANTLKEENVSLEESLVAYGTTPENLKGIAINFAPANEGWAGWLVPLSFILPVVLFLVFFFMIFRQAKSGAGQIFSFLKAPAKLFSDGKDKKENEKVTFKDIAGVEEAKEEIQEVVDFLKNPKKYYKMGARIPRGVLLIGPPGCGKTMLARAVANEAQVPFFSMVGSEFIELFVGVGASRTRSLFAEAKKHQPSIIFIDEVDAIGKMRMPGLGGGHDEREQTLNQILAEMDGFERNTNIIILAATNRPETLDPALLRPGRFDRRIVLDLPDVKGREAILVIHCQGKPLAADVNLIEVAERTPGFSGADIANLVNEAAIAAAKTGREKIHQSELLNSIEKVLLGPERKSHLLSQKEKKISSFHEAGHALISASLPDAEEVRKVSIVSRGMVAGYTLALPKQEKRIKTKSEFLSELCVLLAGYLAEKMVFNELSTGAANDLEKASLLSRALVTKYGMSKLGPIVFGKRETLPFLGWEQESDERNYSEKTASQIDKETERFIREAEAKTNKMLKQKRPTLDKIAKVLQEKETIEKEEFEYLVNQKLKTKVPNQNLKKISSKKPGKKRV